MIDFQVHIIDVLFLIAIFSLWGVYECIFFGVFGKEGYWGKLTFESAKDRNKDGKTTWMERTFPDDGGHLIKRWLVAAIGTGVMWNMPDNPIVFLIESVLGWWIGSAVFEIVFDEIRRRNK